MRRHPAAFTEMLRCTLIGQLRNRMALLLAVAFIPVWIAVARLCSSDRPVRFSLGSPAPTPSPGRVTSARSPTRSPPSPWSPDS